MNDMPLWKNLTGIAGNPDSTPTQMKIRTETSSRWQALRATAAVAVLGLAAHGLPARATQITLQPGTQTVAPGGTVDLTLRISGLGNGVAPSLGAFDLDVSFDPALLTYDSLTFGDPGLGDLLGPISGSATGSTLDAVTGSLNLFGVSLDLPADLDLGQPDQFVLASLRFLATGVGSTSVGLENVVLGDANGAVLVPDAVRGAALSIRAVTGVPDEGPMAPAAFLLAVLSLGRAMARRGMARVA